MWRACAGLGGYGGWGGFGFGGGWMIFHTLFWLTLIGLAIWAMVKHVPAPVIGGGGHPSEAREIARRRYAKGEIGKEEFTQLMKDLD